MHAEAGSGLLVCGGGLGPQVKLGPIRLHLAPYGGQAKGHHGQQDQLLHVVPTSSHNA